jgi:hypothetical protein
VILVYFLFEDKQATKKPSISKNHVKNPVNFNPLDIPPPQNNKKMDSIIELRTQMIAEGRAGASEQNEPIEDSLNNLSESSVKLSNGDIFFSGLKAVFAKPKQGDFKFVGGKYVFKNSDSSNFGVILKNNNVGIVTGELVFINQESEEVLKFANTHNLSVVRNDKNLHVIILNSVSGQIFHDAISDPFFEKLGGNIDAVFYELMQQ